MRVTTEVIERDGIIVLLDGVMMGCVVEADDEEGWVDQFILGQGWQPYAKNSPEGFKPDTGKLTRKTGKVVLQSTEESYAQLLETLAGRVRSREIKVTGISAAMPAERWWSNDKWEFFKIGDQEFGIKYNEPEFVKKELARKEIWLRENPKAENHGITPPFKRPTRSSSDT